MTAVDPAVPVSEPGAKEKVRYRCGCLHLVDPSNVPAACPDCNPGNALTEEQVCDRDGCVRAWSHHVGLARFCDSHDGYDPAHAPEGAEGEREAVFHVAGCCAEPDAGDAEALAGAMSPTADLAVSIATYIDGHYDSDTGAWLNDALETVLPKWLAEYVYADQAALLAATADRARREGAVEALREAADELWGPSYTGGIQWGRTDYVGFLRARADRLETP